MIAAYRGLVMLIFVYGTLLSGLPLSHILDGSEFLGDAVVRGVQLYNIGYYPGIKKGDGIVFGELYYVNNDTLKNLDMVEGYNPNEVDNSLYHRSKIKILLPTILPEVYAYFYNGSVDDSMLIDVGDYREFLQSSATALL